MLLRGSRIVRRSFTILIACGFAAACTNPQNVPTAPNATASASDAASPPPAPPANGLVIGFGDVGGNLSAVTTYTESGVTVAGTLADWIALRTYGHPAPFIEFFSTAGMTTDGEVRVTVRGRRFQFRSVDLYSSTTPIPWVFTGLLNSATVFTVAGRQGNTFGNFATIANPRADAALDALVIRLSNPAAPCCRNPMGLDNIVISY